MNTPQELILKELKKLTDSINTRAILNEAEKFYHPAAIFTNTNDGTVFFGPNNIQLAYGPFLKHVATLKIYPEEFYQTDKNAKYAMVHGYFEIDATSRQYIFKKVYVAGFDGSYKIYHDEINFSHNKQ